MTIRDWPADDRPREKLLSKGAAILSDAELLAILIRQGTAGASALDLARELLKRFESLRQLLNADQRSVCAVAGVGPARYAELCAAAEISRRLAAASLRSGPMLATPKAVREFLSARLRDLPYELFCCLFLDRRQRLVHFEELFRGTLDSASVHPREVVKLALQRNAAAVIVAHNHPSGVAEPSSADESITRRIRDALALVDIRLMDHIIVGDGCAVSFAERGLL